MSLPHALLTSLVEKPGSGSELATRFDRSIGYFWQASHQQIYRELGRLEESGWVESVEVEQSRGRKRDYRILPAGRRELKRWISKPANPKVVRDELLVRLRAEAAVGPAGLDAEMVRHLALHTEKLALYRRIEVRDFSGPVDSREKMLRHLVLKSGIKQEKLWIEMSTEALRILSAPVAKE